MITLRTSLVPVLLFGAAEVSAAVPYERDVQSVRSVQVYQPAGQRTQRPIGAIDFSSSSSAARRLGPWEVETDAFRGAEGAIFYEDGTASGRARDRQYHRDAESRCTTLGNVTVCK